jgi:hypothetical protein
MDRIEKNSSNNSYIVACVLVPAVTVLTSRCLAKIGDAYTDRLMEGIYEVRRSHGLRCHGVHTKFHKDWFRHSKFNKRDTQTQRQHGNRISLLFIFQNKESRLKNKSST